MLVLSRYHGQKIIIHDMTHGGRLEIEVQTPRSAKKVKLAIEADRRFRVMRDELFEVLPDVEDGL